ncbi:MAG: carboxymuconolactone decarboxylase family protein [Candidatus Methanoperedens sp.]|jgi:AhpD family alkylhydroperoxidase|nr:carboxymuconolactone decarboxylase family protein [Candidatus Methanoperedens sp.]PKL53198.1 MAG: carboxymuconolactone decarboxylase family protein [Candidatus Methanoperedenaceae archaeon HGW-Methanoperedenaceae-1]
MELDKIKKILEKEPAEAVEELLREVKELYGEVPYILNFMKQSPELLATKVLYDNSIIREFKRMDEKTVELISIGVSAALKCEHCLKMHIRVAQRLGIPKEEIFDAILIAGSMSNAAVLAEGTRAMDSEISITSCDDKCGVCAIPEEKGKQD